MIKLSPRLRTVAELAGAGGSVIDVGTDHGYVPVYFAKLGLFSRIAASDIGALPLQSAKNSAREHGVEDKIEFYLSDGLKSVAGPFDTVVVAGMGGETMVDIISDCSWVKTSRLILQPQSKLPGLSGWLDENGFTCRRARLVEDGGKLYAAFCSERGEGGFDLMDTLLKGRDPLLEKCLAREKNRLLRALEGMEKGGKRGSAEYDKLRRELEAVNMGIAEVEKWQK